ncbi:unnamed protein product [Calypogeia fissa]
MSSSSELSSSDEEDPLPSQPVSSHPLRGPPRQLCPCTQCMGQVSQKSYISVQHIERFGRHESGHAGASSSRMVSSRPRHAAATPYVPSQAVVDAIGQAFARVFGRLATPTPTPITTWGTSVDEGQLPRERTPRERTRSNRRPRQEADQYRCEVEGRWGNCEFTGRCVPIIKDWNPSTLGLPVNLMYDQEVEVWGRRWIVKTSTLGERHGYGVFACEDIIVDPGVGGGRREGPTLFPYGGPIYKRRHWNMILTQHPEWKTYALELDTHDGNTRRYSEQRVIDGDPIRLGNIVGFINSTVGTRPKRRQNCEWVFIEGPPPAPYGQIYHHDHCLVVATRTIVASDELFTHYEWD